MPRAEALAMLRAQVDRATRLKAAHDVIDNSGAPEVTRRQVEQLHQVYLGLARQRSR
jgi:dephospho-CoA kinase